MITKCCTILWHPAWRLPLFVVIGLTISVLSLSPQDTLPPVPGSDKTHHLIAYGLWSCMLWLYPHKTNPMLFICILLWGGVIEIVQPWVNRYGEWLDFVANASGALLAMALALLIVRYCKPRIDV